MVLSRHLRRSLPLRKMPGDASGFWGLSISTYSQAPITLFRSTMARFFLPCAFQAAGGEVDFCSLADRSVDDSDECVGRGDIGVGTGGCGSAACFLTGDECSVRSSVSTFGDVDLELATESRGEVRSRLSMSGLEALVLLGRVWPKASLILFCLPDPVDDVELVDAWDAFDDIEIRGGRVNVTVFF